VSYEAALTVFTIITVQCYRANVDSLCLFLSTRSASYGGLQNWKLAAEDAKECIRLDPSFIKGYYRLAAAQIELKDYDAAMATIRQGLSLENNNVQLLKQMRIIKQAQKVEAAKLASKAASASNATLDEGASRELRELRGQYNQGNQEFGTLQANLTKAQREHKMTEITKTELDDLTEETKCYRSIGKMFMQSTRTDVTAHLDKQMQDLKKSEGDMTQKMEYLERKMKSQRQNIEELTAAN
jgi:chaperonin cofactor prefoldin